jgi:pimeloyl-ACP methyl ester carboxylesterase
MLPRERFALHFVFSSGIFIRGVTPYFGFGEVLPFSLNFQKGFWGTLLTLLFFIYLCISFAWYFLNSHRGVAHRSACAHDRSAQVPDPDETVPLDKAWYIESKSNTPFSCSFVEFDERGDYLSFNQHRHARKKVRELAEKAALDGRYLTLVIYVHGWRNNSESGDVVSFNDFLRQLAEIDSQSSGKTRVHGVYVAWRGACLIPFVDRGSEKYKTVNDAYSGDIVSPPKIPGVFQKPLKWVCAVLETCSYFNRKAVPEYKFSATSVSRTLFECAHQAKRYPLQPNQSVNSTSKNRVILMGHSMGALLLERTVKNAAISLLARIRTEGGADVSAQNRNPLPFDMVLLVNSAAPSIYAKQFQSYLAGFREALAKAKVSGADMPFFFSLTSTRDKATGVWHRVANYFFFFVPSLRRDYVGADFMLHNSPDELVPQSYYYQFTPGHNRLLVNRVMSPAPSIELDSSMNTVDILRKNLSETHAWQSFQTSPRQTGEAPSSWEIKFPPEMDAAEMGPAETKFWKLDQSRPVIWEKKNGHYAWKETAYWIIRCPDSIISGHSDIWSEQAIQTYAALYRIALMGDSRFGETPVANPAPFWPK